MCRAVSSRTASRLMLDEGRVTRVLASKSSVNLEMAMLVNRDEHSDRIVGGNCFVEMYPVQISYIATTQKKQI